MRETRCDLFEVDRATETESPEIRDRNCETEYHLRNLQAILGVEVSQKTWACALRLFARATQVHARPVYALGVGVAYSFPR
jgi:hypothetical protein